MAISTSVNNSATIMAWFEKKALDREVQETHLYSLSYKQTLETGRGKSVTWVRFGIQAGNTTPLTEGSLVAPTTVSSNNIVANLLQYGEVFAAADVLNDTSVTPMEEALQDQAVQAMSYTTDALIRNEVMSSCTTFNSNLFAANGAASVAALVAADTLRAADLRKAAGILGNNNVPKFDGGRYVGVISASQGYSVRSETNAGSFLTIMQQNPKGIEVIDADGKKINKDKSLLGEIFGLALYESSLQPVISNGTVNVNYGFFFGDNSLAACNLASQNMELFRKRPAGGTYDPLEQIGMIVGYKMFFASKNLSEQPVSTTNQRVLVFASAPGL